MATSSTTGWLNGFSDSPTGDTPCAKTIIEMLDLIGGEKVAAPGILPDDPDRRLITRRELLARVLWTRAILNAEHCHGTVAVRRVR